MAGGDEQFNITRISTIKLNRSDFTQDDCKEEEVQADQQLWNQEKNSFVKLEEPDPPEIKEEQEERELPQIKVEQEEFSIGQQRELSAVKVEDDAFMVPPVYEENSQSEGSPNSEQFLCHNSSVTEVKDEERCWRGNSGSTKEEEPKPKTRRFKIRSHSNSDDEFVIQWENETDDSQLHDCKEEDVLNVLQFRNEEYSGLDQEEQDGTQIKEEELGTSPVEDEHQLKQETGPFMDSPVYEGSDHSDAEKDSDYFPSHSPGSSNHKIQKTNKKVRRSRSHSKKVSNSSMSENPCNTGIRTVTGKKGLSCEICGKCYSTGHGLTYHMRSHTGEKPFSCKICGKCYSSGHGLTYHVRSHTGEKPFSCEICGQTFTRNNCLKRHVRMHTGDKPFSCETCGKCFYSHHDLTDHVRTHTGEKPFSCETCLKRFSSRHALTNHVRAHTNAPHFHKGILSIHQLCYQKNASLDQGEKDPAQVKEEEFCISQEQKHFGLKQETDTFMVTPTYEDNDNGGSGSNSEQLLSNISADPERQSEGAGSEDGKDP
ncbi:uncharacterized protein KZ484_000044 [Pholidichthys leucotaenia]